MVLFTSLLGAMSGALHITSVKWATTASMILFFISNAAWRAVSFMLHVMYIGKNMSSESFSSLCRGLRDTLFIKPTRCGKTRALSIFPSLLRVSWRRWWRGTGAGVSGVRCRGGSGGASSGGKVRWGEAGWGTWSATWKAYVMMWDTEASPGLEDAGANTLFNAPREQRGERDFEVWRDGGKQTPSQCSDRSRVTNSDYLRRQTNSFILSDNSVQRAIFKCNETEEKKLLLNEVEKDV